MVGQRRGLSELGPGRGSRCSISWEGSAKRRAERVQSLEAEGRLEPYAVRSLLPVIFCLQICLFHLTLI